nr:hypothetical protein [Pandoravirus massiliensis]
MVPTIPMRVIHLIHRQACLFVYSFVCLDGDPCPVDRSQRGAAGCQAGPVDALLLSLSVCSHSYATHLHIAAACLFSSLVSFGFFTWRRRVRAVPSPMPPRLA